MNSVHDDVSVQLSTIFNVPLSLINQTSADSDDQDEFMQTVMEYINFLRLLNGQMSVEDTDYEFEITSDSDEEFEYQGETGGNIFDIRHHITVRAVDTFQPRNFIMRPDCLRSDTPIINDTCCICLDTLAETDKQIAQLDTCQHGFCRECLFIWLKTHCLCPVCRTVCTKINLIK